MPRCTLSLCIRCALVAATSVAGAGGADAQQHSTFEGEVVVTATGREEDPDDVPSAVTVIDRQEIAGYPPPGRRFLAGLRWRQ